MRLSDIAGHLAFLLIALSFVVTDILWLRGISVVASVAGILYNYFAPDRPLWLVIGWNVVFILVNAWQIFRLIKERRPIAFNEEEQSLYDLIFSDLEPRKFKRVLEAGRWADFGPKSLLVQEGTENGDVLLIGRGRVAVEKEGAKVGELGTGAFVGEMSYIRGCAANATVRSVETTRCLLWERASLNHLFETDPAVRAVFHAGITEDLAEKLSRQKKMKTGIFFARK